ncbi:MAG: carboxylesterase family protein [Bacteroidota bacterium]
MNLLLMPTDEVDSPRARISSGVLEGCSHSGIHAYLGIPYAQAPVEDLRWRPPQPLQNWEGVRKADKFGPRGMQRPLFDDMVFRSDGMSEDCLYLNVWTPANPGEERLPVLVYFYGGGLFTGDGSEARYQGESMARRGIVTLTVNYRLNVFGFLAHPELSKESPHAASGNYGFLDQMAALQWVQENITAFGGDPERVTIAGESAGSVSVSAQMMSPLSKDLMAAAIGSSASILGTLGAVPLEEGEQVGEKFQQLAKASSLAELRSMPAEELLELTSRMEWAAFLPTIDGYFFPGSVFEMYAEGKQAKIPLLIGWNSQESPYQAILGEEAPTVEHFQEKLRTLYPNHAEEAIRLYHAENTEEVTLAARDLASDRFTGYSSWKWADLHLQTSDQAVFRYLYAHPRPALSEDSPTGAVHSAEIEYAMGNLPQNRVYRWTAEDYRVSAVFQTYYENFVKTGNPNGLGVPNWPAMEKDNPQIQIIDVKTHSIPEPNRERYLFLDQFYGK